MNTINRREALAGLFAAGVGTLAANGQTPGPLAQTLAPAFAGKHVPKPLPFNPAKLNGISEKLIVSHHDNNYVGAVKALNTLEPHLIGAAKNNDIPAFLYGEMKREELIRTGSIVLHEHYFANLGGNGKADGTAAKMIKDTAAMRRGRASSRRSEMHLAADLAGRSSGITSTPASCTTTGRRTTHTIPRSRCRSS